jgi:putative DNA primase/helicase
MSASPADKGDQNSYPENYLQPEVKGDGFMFPLRDGAYLLIKMQSAATAVVTMWQGDTFIAPDAGNFFATSFRERLIKAAQAGFGEKAKNIAVDIEQVAKKLGAPQKTGKTLLEELKEAEDRSTMERLILYARSAATYFHNSEREGFASIVKDGHRENYEISSPRFKLWVRHEFWRREKERLEAAELAIEGALHEGPVKNEMPAVVRDRDLGDAVRQLESIALFEGRQEEVHIRTAGHDDRVYIDMGDDAWRAIEVSPEGWRIVEGEEIPVRFIRPKGLLALPEPAPSGEGSLDGLLNLLNLGEGEDAKRNRILILAWLSHAYLPTGPYPVLTLTGPQGAAKSHALRILRNLVDPSVAPGSTKPRSEHDAYIDASANWVIAYDNLPTVPPWLSNVLCDIATGGFRTRTLYTNRDQEIFQDKRPIILAGIGSVATRSDLLDRAAIVNLPRIDPKARRKEATISRMLREAQPQILSALLDAVCAGLARKDDVVLEQLPRMADFSVWGIATEEALGGERGDFMAAYTESRQDASDVALEAWALSDTFIEFAHQFEGEKNAWEGTATALLKRLNDRVEDEDLKRGKEWPKSASSLSAQINALVPDLLEIGINVESTRNKKKRTLRVFVAEAKSMKPSE